MNKNRFHLQTKIYVKTNVKDKKALAKKFMEANFPGGYFLCWREGLILRGAIFWGEAIFLEANFQKIIFREAFFCGEHFSRGIFPRILSVIKTGGYKVFCIRTTTTYYNCYYSDIHDKDFWVLFAKAFQDPKNSSQK